MCTRQLRQCLLVVRTAELFFFDRGENRMIVEKSDGGVRAGSGDTENVHGRLRSARLRPSSRSILSVCCNTEQEFTENLEKRNAPQSGARGRRPTQETQSGDEALFHLRPGQRTGLRCPNRAYELIGR